MTIAGVLFISSFQWLLRSYLCEHGVGKRKPARTLCMKAARNVTAVILRFLAAQDLHSFWQ